MNESTVQRSNPVRRHEFRGISRSTGEWVYGSLVRAYLDDDGADWWIFEDTTVHQAMINRYQHIIDPATVGAFIGRLDRNLVPIYAGDILGDLIGGVVVYLEEETRFALDFDGELHEVYMHEYDQSDLLVVGNIYDNPECLD